MQALRSRPWEADAAPRRFLGNEYERGALGPRILGEEDFQKTIFVLVIKGRMSKLIISAAALLMTTRTFIAQSVAGFLREVGCLHGCMVVKSHQDPALRPIVEHVGRLKVSDGSGRYVVQYSLEGASQGNGIIERATQSVSGQTRVLLSALEEKLGCSIP